MCKNPDFTAMWPSPKATGARRRWQTRRDELACSNEQNTGFAYTQTASGWRLNGSYPFSSDWNTIWVAYRRRLRPGFLCRRVGPTACDRCSPLLSKDSDWNQPIISWRKALIVLIASCQNLSHCIFMRLSSVMGSDWRQKSRKSLHLPAETENTFFPTIWIKTQISTSVALK